jgi:hypothetical protein
MTMCPGELWRSTRGADFELSVKEAQMVHDQQ